MSENRSLDDFLGVDDADTDGDTDTDTDTDGDTDTDAEASDVGDGDVAASDCSTDTGVEQTVEAAAEETAGADDAVTSADTADATDTPDTADTADTADATDTAPERPRATYRWSPVGDDCPACGTTVQRRWREGDRFVCADCKEW